jgi:hypothetical protein
MSGGIWQFETDQEGVLEFYPPEGVASSATIQIVKPDGSDLHASSAVTLDTVDTTVSGINRDDETFTVGSGTGIVTARRYWLATDGGRGYETGITEIDGATVRPEEPVSFDISSGTFKGHGLRYTMTTTETDDTLRNCRVVWRYTVDSINYMESTVIDIVPLPFRAKLTDGDMRDIEPLWGGLSSEYRAAIDQAELEIFGDIKSRNKLPSRVIDRRLLCAPMKWKVLQIRYFRGNDGPSYERASERYMETMAPFDLAETYYDNDDGLDLDAATVDPDGTFEQGGDLRRLASWIPVG